MEVGNRWSGRGVVLKASKHYYQCEIANLLLLLLWQDIIVNNSLLIVYVAMRVDGGRRGRSLLAIKKAKKRYEP